MFAVESMTYNQQEGPHVRKKRRVTKGKIYGSSENHEKSISYGVRKSRGELKFQNSTWL